MCVLVFVCIRGAVVVVVVVVWRERGWRRTILQMAGVSMAAIKRWEVSGQG